LRAAVPTHAHARALPVCLPCVDWRGAAPALGWGWGACVCRAQLHYRLLFGPVRVRGGGGGGGRTLRVQRRRGCTRRAVYTRRRAARTKCCLNEIAPACGGPAGLAWCVTRCRSWPPTPVGAPGEMEGGPQRKRVVVHVNGVAGKGEVRTCVRSCPAMSGGLARCPVPGLSGRIEHAGAVAAGDRDGCASNDG
jgi:hypothetical protein